MTKVGAAYRADIQGLRGLAVLLVVAFHAGLLPGGFVGVDVFFVLSGFVITRLLATELDTSGRLNLGRFYGRRIRRLFPALALMLLIVLLGSGALGALGSLQVTARTGAAAALCVANLFLYRSGGGGYFDEASDFNPLIHTWSLSVEEQFYLSFPALLGSGWWLAGRLGHLDRQRRSWFVALLGLLLCAVSLALSVRMTGGGGFRGIADPRLFAFYSAPTRAWEFGTGAIVALAHGGSWCSGAIQGRFAAAAGWMLIGWSALRFGPGTSFPGLAATAPVLGTAFLVVAGGADEPADRMVQILHWRLLVWVGDLSYSWYLWHWPLIVLARTLFPAVAWMPGVMAVLSLGPAWLSYIAVEGPLRSWRPPSRVSMAALALGCMCVPALGAAALEVLNRALPGIERVAAYTTATRRHLDGTADCAVSAPLRNSPDSGCVWPVSNARGRIVLIGDSNAGHHAEPVIRGGNQLGYSVEVASRSSCPFVDLRLRRHEVGQDACRSFFESALRWLLTTPPDLVIVASASDNYIRTDQWTLAGPGRAEWQVGPEGKSSLWAAQLESTLRSLHESGSEVLLVHPIPKLQPWRARSCAVVLAAFWPQFCGASRPREEALEGRKAAVEAELTAARSTGAQTLDFADDLCPRSTCDAWRDGVWWYRDSGHLGVDGALKLTPRFQEAMTRSLSPNAIPTRAELR